MRICICTYYHHATSGIKQPTVDFTCLHRCITLSLLFTTCFQLKEQFLSPIMKGCKHFTLLHNKRALVLGRILLSQKRDPYRHVHFSTSASHYYTCTKQFIAKLDLFPAQFIMPCHHMAATAINGIRHLIYHPTCVCVCGHVCVCVVMCVCVCVVMCVIQCNGRKFSCILDTTVRTWCEYFVHPITTHLKQLYANFSSGTVVWCIICN